MYGFPSNIFLIQKWRRKWLQKQRTTPLWPLNVWPFARHWPARARNLPSLSTSAPPSASPWTPGRRYQRSNHLEKGRAHQHREEMQGEGKPFWKRKLNLLLLPWGSLNMKFLWKKLKIVRRLRWKFSSVTNVRIHSNPKMDWRFILGKHTRKWSQLHHHPRCSGCRRSAQRSPLPPPSWTPAGRRSGRRRRSQSLLFNPHLNGI